MDLQEELHILDRDIHHVESRQLALPAKAGRLLALPHVANPTWLRAQQQENGLSLVQHQSLKVGEVPQGGEGQGVHGVLADVRRQLLNGVAGEPWREQCGTKPRKHMTLKSRLEIVNQTSQKWQRVSCLR